MRVLYNKVIVSCAVLASLVGSIHASEINKNIIKGNDCDQLIQFSSGTAQKMSASSLENTSAYVEINSIESGQNDIKHDETEHEEQKKL